METDFQVADKVYSIREASRLLKRSESQIKNYKTTMLKAFAKRPSMVVVKSGSLTAYGLEQLRIVQKYYAQGNPDGYVSLVWAEHSELADDHSQWLGSDQAEPAQRTVPTVSDDEPVDGEIVDDGSEFAENSAIVLRKKDQGLANAENGFTVGVVALKGRLKSYIKAQVKTAVKEAMTEAFEEAGVNEVFTLESDMDGSS